MQFWRWLAHLFAPGAHNDHRPHLLRRPWLLALLSITLAAEGFLVADLVARQSSQSFLAAVVPGEIIALTNSERQHNDVGTLTENAQLDAAAQAKASDMAARGYFSHVGPNGKTPWQWIAGAGYQYEYAGENLAVRFVDSQDVVNAWMASPTHRANIVKPVYTQIGVGVANGTYEGEPATYVVQYFGTPLASAAPAPVARAPAPTPAPAPKVAAVQPASAPQPARVEGAAVPAPPQASAEQVAATAPAVPVSASAPPASTWGQSFVRGVMRALAEPGATANTILGIVAALMVAVLASTFFIHLQIQHPRMLASGALVAGMAILFLMFNLRLSGAGAAQHPPPGAAQAASPAEAAAVPGVVIDTQAASAGFALFPR